MPESTAQPRPRRALALSGAVVFSIMRRAYAAVLIVVIVWLTFLAVRYLFRSLIRPIAAPPQVMQLPTRLGEEVLRERREQWAALEATENARSPLAHYHRFEGWIEPDRFNDCTRSGCHLALPHARRKEVRAFLNMHAPSVHCSVCHIQSADTPLPVAWYSLANGKPCGPPAGLRAYEFVTGAEERQRLAHPTGADQARLAALLREAAEAADGAPALRDLAARVAAVRVESEAFQELVGTVRTTLPEYFRGEYGAKLALYDPQTKKPVLGFPGTAAAVKEWLERGSTLNPTDRAALLVRVHPLKREQALHCSDCHRQAGGLVDFAHLGYPEARRDALFRPAIFQMIEHISSGQPMHLPEFTTP